MSNTFLVSFIYLFWYWRKIYQTNRPIDCVYDPWVFSLLISVFVDYWLLLGTGLITRYYDFNYMFCVLLTVISVLEQRSFLFSWVSSGFSRYKHCSCLVFSSVQRNIHVCFHFILLSSTEVHNPLSTKSYISLLIPVSLNVSSSVILTYTPQLIIYIVYSNSLLSALNSRAKSRDNLSKSTSGEVPPARLKPERRVTNDSARRNSVCPWIAKHVLQVPS